MAHTILLYGATGYSGGLIAEEAARLRMDGRIDCRMVLAGRDQRRLSALARDYGMDARVFGLDNRSLVVQQLQGVDVVINAAGPLAMTAEHLAKGALAAQCHYVDINGEAEVYMRLDDLGPHAERRRLALVSGAGHTAAASDLLLSAALQKLRSGYQRGQLELGAVRIAMSRLTTMSRGSLETLWRALREQVRTVRIGEVTSGGASMRGHVFWHEPVGRLERMFDFFDKDRQDISPQVRKSGRNLQVASAANLVDTLTARRTIEREGCLAQRIESYVEVGDVGRTVFQLAPLLAPVAALPWTRTLAGLQFDALPAGPNKEERAAESHLVVLEIEDRLQQRVIDWTWHTPNPYDFTARIVIDIACEVAKANGALYGWLTPAEVLQRTADLQNPVGALRGCRLTERKTELSDVA